MKNISKRGRQYRSKPRVFVIAQAVQGNAKRRLIREKKDGRPSGEEGQPSRE